MKYLLTLVLLSCSVFAADVSKVSECFKVNSLIKMDEDHYWANWTNACPFTIDSVYVMVKFADRDRNNLGRGVWALHFVTPGTHRVTRLSSPKTALDFEFISVSKITIDSAEALR